jgi:hypothetical protein
MVLVEIIGEPAVGKTHLSLTFPKPFIFDTTPKREARSVATKLLGAETQKRYMPVKSYQELVKTLKEVLRRDDVKTIVIDTGADLQGMCVEYEVERKGRERLLPVEYGRIREMIDTDVTEAAVEANKNLVMTAQMEDEYVNGQKTGRRIPKGYKRMAFQADIRLFLYLSPPEGGGELEVSPYGLTFAYIPPQKPALKLVRKAVVIKNRYVDMTSTGYQIIENPTAEKIKELIPENIRKEEWIE